MTINNGNTVSLKELKRNTLFFLIYVLFQNPETFDDLNVLFH